MAETLPSRVTANQLTTISEGASLARALISWRMSDEIPDEATPALIATLHREMEHHMAPAGVAATMVILRDLFTIFTPPTERAMTIYIEMLSALPEWALAAGVKLVMGSRVYTSAPQPAEILAAAKSQQMYRDRFCVLSSVKLIQMRWRKFPAQIPSPALVGRVDPPMPAVKEMPREAVSPRAAEAQMQRDRAQVLKDMAADGMDGAVDGTGNLVDNV